MRDYLPLQFFDGTHLKFRQESFLETKTELESFISDKEHLKTEDFAKDVLFSHEIKANNSVEGYSDDVDTVKSVIRKHNQVNDERSKRILNLYYGYNYILHNSVIDKNHLKELYAILSNGLLKETEINRMGNFYREDKVYILKSGRLDLELDEGINYHEIDKFMNYYFEFLNNFDMGTSITDEYIKSQILHFYFVYIHPFFDVNGRTSRTMSMWYLLNKKAYPYIIFNRGITFKGSEYDKAIIDVKKYHDISFFIDYMLKTVQVELEKEYIMQAIDNNIDAKLTAKDWQTMFYILTMNGLVTSNDFTSLYNRFNDKTKSKNIYEDMILPLIEKEVLVIKRNTKGKIYNDVPNVVVDFNPKVMDFDRSMIKRLTKYRQ